MARFLNALTAVVVTAGVAFAAPHLTIDVPRAGIDFPTDTAVPRTLVGASVLVIDGHRIIVGAKSTLATPAAGIDYPTSATIPARLVSAQILVIDGKRRIPIALEAATPGAIWVFGNAVRLPVAKIARLERAVAGIDVPTDGPPTLDRDFYVAVTLDGTRSRIQ